MNYKMNNMDPFGALLTPTDSNNKLLNINSNKIKNLVDQEALVVLRGFELGTSQEDLLGFCELFGDIIIWPFGKVLELTKREQPEDHIFDHSYVPMHWDGMYRREVPQYQIFQCLEAPKSDEGGRTTFTHTPSILKNMSLATIKKLRSIKGTYQRDMEFYDSKTVAPIIDRHPITGVEVIRYNEPVKKDGKDFINPPIQTFEGVEGEELDVFHQTLVDALYSENNLYAHQWRAGDIVLADNFTLLHGREAFRAESSRHLRRVQVMSHLRLPNPHLVSHK